MSDQPPLTDDQIHANLLAKKRLVGGLLMATGSLIALLCGLCTLAGGAMVNALAHEAEAGPLQGRQLLSVVLIPLIIGGPAVAIGVFLFGVGLKMYREGRKRGGEPWKAFE